MFTLISGRSQSEMNATGRNRKFTDLENLSSKRWFRTIWESERNAMLCIQIAQDHEFAGRRQASNQPTNQPTIYPHVHNHTSNHTHTNARSLAHSFIHSLAHSKSWKRNWYFISTNTRPKSSIISSSFFFLLPTISIRSLSFGVYMRIKQLLR